MADAKLEAFRAFDFEGSEAWQAHSRNLEIPAGKELYARAKWYAKNVDPDFDASSVAASSAPKATPSVAAAADAARQAAAGVARGAASAAQAAASAARLAADRVTHGGGSSTHAAASARAGQAGETVLLVAHVVMLACAVLTLQPLLRPLSWSAYFLFCRTALIACGYKVYLRFGAPSLRPFPAALAPWLQQVAQSTEFFHFLLVTLMMQAPQLWMGVVPLALAAAPPALQGLGARFGSHPPWTKYGSRAQAALEQARPAILQFSANLEIALGFQTILVVMSSGLRGLMLVYVYWNTLRVRYWAPESRPYHMQAWASMRARVQPLLALAPSLERYLQFPINWFQQMGQRGGAHRQ